MRKIQSLEMLRAIAALLVVLFHAETIFSASGHTPFDGLFRAGNRGIDLFFVLSGFIIAYVHQGDLGRPGRLGHYLYNRITRIYPAALIVTALALALYTLGFGGAEKAAKLDPGAVAASFLLLAQQGPPLVNVTWTLTYEVFFYAVFAIAILNRKAGLIALVVWQAAAAILAITGTDLGFAGYYLRSISLEFSVGLAAAWWLISMPPARQAWLAWAGVVLGVSGFVAGMALNNVVTWGAVVCTIASAVLIAAFARLEQAGRIRVPSILVRLGGASYAIYMVHYSVITLLGVIIMRKLHWPVTDALCLVCAAIGIACGLVFDRVLDRPIQRALRRRKRVASKLPADARFETSR
jgi:exopolysaccharide production protein ExoZ